MVVGIVVGREHDENRPRHARVHVVRHYTLKNRPFEDAIELPAIGVEVVSAHRVLVFPTSLLRLLLLGNVFPRLAFARHLRCRCGRGKRTAPGRADYVNRRLRRLVGLEVDGDRIAIEGVEALFFRAPLPAAWLGHAPPLGWRSVAAHSHCYRRSPEPVRASWA